MTRVPILLYHSISPVASGRFRPWTVPPRRFAEHLALLAELGYQPVTMSQLDDACSGAGPRLPPRPVAITIDDGFADFASAALPALERYGFASTLYVTTGYLGGGAGWLAREGEGRRRMLSWEQVADLAGRGVEIGAHSHSHPKLDELGTRAARDEIRRSRRLLEDHLQRPVRSFAYPHGYHGPRIRRLVVEEGFGSAAAVRHAMSATDDDRFARARIIVGADTSLARLQALLRGEGLPQAPYRPPLRSGVWRATRRGLRTAGHPASRHPIGPGGR